MIQRSLLSETHPIEDSVDPAILIDALSENGCEDNELLDREALISAFNDTNCLADGEG
jgi:hypothetical protein